MPRNYIGSPIKRKEDARFLTGTAQYVADVKLPSMLHAAVLRSPHAHARITAIDASQALELSGVHGVYTFDDIAPVAKPIPVRVFHLPGLEDFLQHHLAGDKVRYVGEPVAVVVAESRYLAEDALEAIQVDYEPLPAVTDVRQSLEDRILLHEQNGSNLAGHAVVGFGDINAVFLNADYTRKEEFRTHRHTGNPLETRGLVADYQRPDRRPHRLGPHQSPTHRQKCPGRPAWSLRRPRPPHRTRRRRRIRHPRRVLSRGLPHSLRRHAPGQAREVD